MSLFEELKRRKVFKVAATYLVVAWLLIQVVATVSPQLQLPDWAPRLVTLLLMVGLPIALVFAWALEVTPEGVKVEVAQVGNKRVYGIAGVLFLAALGWYFLVPARDERDADRAETPAQTAAGEGVQAPRQGSDSAPETASRKGSVAVLPFANRSSEPDTAYFVDGVHDDLLTQLSRNPELKVISRTSVMEYRDTTKNMREIGEELGVAHLLEGAVQRAGKRVRVNAQLIDAATDEHLWAEIYDRELTPENVFEIQTEIAAAIASALGKALAKGMDVPPAGAAPTRNAKAWDLYLRARALSDKGTTDDITGVIALYRQALVEDPGFALAMGELALELTNSYWFGSRRTAERDEAKLWIDRALALAPQDPRLRWINARHLYHGYLDYEAALEQLALAEKGLPGSADIFSLRGWILRRMGRAAEAIENANAALVLDPRSLLNLEALIETHGLLGDVSSAQRLHQRMMAMPGLEPDAAMRYAVVRMGVLGDVDAILRVLDALPEVYRSDYDFLYFITAMQKHDFPRAAQVIDSYRDEMVDDQEQFAPRALLRAQLARAQGQEAEARRLAAEAIPLLDKHFVREPGDFRAQISKATALGILGRGDEARALLAQVLAAPVATKDAYRRSDLRAAELGVLAMLVDSEELARAIDAYLGLEMKTWHYDGLILDPVYDAHREHPAMQALARRQSRASAGAGTAP